MAQHNSRGARLNNAAAAAARQKVDGRLSAIFGCPERAGKTYATASGRTVEHNSLGQKTQNWDTKRAAIDSLRPALRSPAPPVRGNAKEAVAERTRTPRVPQSSAAQACPLTDGLKARLATARPPWGLCKCSKFRHWQRYTQLAAALPTEAAAAGLHLAGSTLLPSLRHACPRESARRR